MRSANNRRHRMLFAAGLVACLFVLGGCAKSGGAEAMERLRREPIFRPPPGTTELHRSSTNPQGGGLMGVEQSGTLEVVWSSTAEPDTLRDHYMEAHGERYRLHEERAGYVRLAGLGDEVDGWRFAYSVYIQTEPPDVLGDQFGGAPSVGGGTRTYVLISGSVS